MPWMCLERCGWNTSSITSHLASIKSHASLLTGVSFELYNLGANGTLVLNSDLTAVTKPLQQLGLETYPMISSYPYPPQFLSWMRQLWDPTLPYGNSFIAQLHHETAVHNYTGWNVDWEPAHGDPTEEDAVAYARFLDRLVEELPGTKITVDISSWSKLWNWTVLADTKVHRVITMSTYANKLSTFSRYLERGMSTFGRAQLGVGLSTLNLATNETMKEDAVRQRFQLMREYSVQEIDIWKMPIPDFWWGYIKSLWA